MSASTSLAPGVRLEIKGRAFVSRGRGPGGKLKLENEKTSQITYVSPERVNDLLVSCGARLLPPSELDDLVAPRPVASIPIDLSALPESDAEAARMRYEYVRAVQSAALPALTPKWLLPVIAATKQKREDDLAPHWRTVIRWIEAYRTSRSVTALIAERRGNSHGRLGLQLEGLMGMAVEKHFLTMARKTLKETHKQLELLVCAENELIDAEKTLAVPSLRALRRYVSRMDKFDVMARRFGLAYARKWFHAYGRGEVAKRPLDIVQVDHTILDLEVVFLGLLNLGRPTVTVVMDQFTRMVLAILVSFEPPSYLSVMSALRTAILPKDELIRPLKESGYVRGDWPAHGVPGVLSLDNGKEFTGHDLKNACAHLGTELRFCPPRQPWFKGSIERFLLTLKNDLVISVPGRTFPIKEERADYQPGAWHIDLDDLQNILITWVVDVYHRSIHSTLGTTPYSAWVNGQGEIA